MLLKTPTIDRPNTLVHAVHTELVRTESYNWTEFLMTGEESAILKASAADKQDPERREGGREVCCGDASEGGKERLDDVSVDEEAEEDR